MINREVLLPALFAAPANYVDGLDEKTPPAGDSRLASKMFRRWVPRAGLRPVR
jgi:hypothetical protein